MRTSVVAGETLMGIAGLFVCAGGLIGLVAALLVGSVIVRAAVALANRILGPAEVPDTFGQWDDWDSDEPAPKPRKHKTRVIPEPGLATGMLVTLLSGLVGPGGIVVCAVLAREAFNDLDGPDELVPLAFLILLLPIGFGLLTLLLSMLLPTTFWRAARVAFLHYLIVFALALGTVAAAYLAWEALAP